MQASTTASAVNDASSVMMNFGAAIELLTTASALWTTGGSSGWSDRALAIIATIAAGSPLVLTYTAGFSDSSRARYRTGVLFSGVGPMAEISATTPTIVSQSPPCPENETRMRCPTADTPRQCRRANPELITTSFELALVSTMVRPSTI